MGNRRVGLAFTVRYTQGRVFMNIQNQSPRWLIEKGKGPFSESVREDDARFDYRGWRKKKGGLGIAERSRLGVD